MSKRDAAPTLGWVFSSHIYKYLAWAFLAFLLVTFIYFYTLFYSLGRDCTNLYSRDFHMFGMWFEIDAGSTKDGCPSTP
jgi:phosphoglycerol transferase MdoB-like AlkP superfamily enzyme